MPKKYVVFAFWLVAIVIFLLEGIGIVDNWEDLNPVALGLAATVAGLIAYHFMDDVVP